MNISQEQFQEWLENPVTETVQQFLRDRAQALEGLQAGVCLSLDQLIAQNSLLAESITQRDLLLDLADLAFDDMSNFYEEDND